jgi:phosphatidylinositol kinase/protein kinase (PI-3  family)
MKSKEKPVKFGFIGSDKRTYYFLMKKEPSENTDVRKESRVIDMIDYLDNILQNDESTESLGLSMKSYSIVSLTRTINLVEWVDKSSTLKTIIFNYDKDIMSRNLLQLDGKKLMQFSLKQFLEKVSQCIPH